MGRLFLKRVELIKLFLYSVEMYKCLPGDDVNTRVLRC